MVLFRKNALFLPLQISIFDLGFSRLASFLSNFISFKIAKFHCYDYRTGDFYFDPKTFEKVKNLLSQKIEIAFLKNLKALYRKTEKKLLESANKYKVPLKYSGLEVLFEDYLEFAKYPLLSKLLPELISVKIQESTSLPPEIFLRLVRPRMILSRKFCERSLALSIDFAQDEEIFRLFLQQDYPKMIEVMKQHPYFQKRFNQFIADFYAFGPRRWDIEGCENPITALKMIHESSENLDRKALIKHLKQIKKERMNHNKFLEKQVKRLSRTQNKFLEYLWFFQSALDSETPIQRLAFFKSLLSALVDKGKDCQKSGLVKAEEDVLFMEVGELVSQRFSAEELTKRKKNYFSLIHKLKDPGNITFFKRLVK